VNGQHDVLFRFIRIQKNTIRLKITHTASEIVILAMARIQIVANKTVTVSLEKRSHG
jgi:hypothetical protein